MFISCLEIIQPPLSAFVSSVLKDIKAERNRMTEKDSLRLLFLAKWFLEFFLALRTAAAPEIREEKWSLDLVAEVVERDWISWVLRRMREAVDNKVS